MIWTIFPTAFYASFRSRSILSHKKKLLKINSVKRNNFCANLTSACIQLKRFDRWRATMREAHFESKQALMCVRSAHQLSNLSQRGYTSKKG